MQNVTLCTFVLWITFAIVSVFKYYYHMRYPHGVNYFLNTLWDVEKTGN